MSVVDVVDLYLALIALALLNAATLIWLRIEYDKRKRIERVLADLHGRMETTQLTMMDLLIEVRTGRKP